MLLKSDHRVRTFVEFFFPGNVCKLTTVTVSRFTENSDSGFKC